MNLHFIQYVKYLCDQNSVKTDLLPYGAVSRLYLANAAQRDAGNYTCTISESSWTTVVVHILNGNDRQGPNTSLSKHSHLKL